MISEACFNFVFLHHFTFKKMSQSSVSSQPSSLVCEGRPARRQRRRITNENNAGTSANVQRADHQSSSETTRVTRDQLSPQNPTFLLIPLLCFCMKVVCKGCTYRNFKDKDTKEVQTLAEVLVNRRITGIQINHPDLNFRCVCGKNTCDGCVFRPVFVKGTQYFYRKAFCDLANASLHHIQRYFELEREHQGRLKKADLEDSARLDQDFITQIKERLTRLERERRLLEFTLKGLGITYSARLENF